MIPKKKIGRFSYNVFIRPEFSDRARALKAYNTAIQATPKMEAALGISVSRMAQKQYAEVHFYSNETTIYM
ncbi:MAG: hypothetical protein LUQ22_03630 [Methanotrichaceae archaeon]|nr:hypothetical protein [Methanotrichaceae archaeon]